MRLLRLVTSDRLCGPGRRDGAGAVGRGRALDNVFIERLWRTVKYENVYLRDYANGLELAEGLATYCAFYKEDR